MNVTQAEFQNMKEEIIKDLIAFRMEDTGCSMQLNIPSGKVNGEI